MQRPVFAMTVFVVCSALTFSGCSEETPPELAEGTYAATYRAQIETDCDKRVVCADRSNPHLAEDAFDECVLEQARKLNVPPPNPPVPGQPDHRLKFQLGIRRCTDPDQCHYVACVDSGFTSFGEVQIDKVKYTCQQKVQCQIDSALLAGDATSIYESCILQSVVVLDTFSTEARASFQQQFFPCAQMTSCAYTTCFPF